MKNIKLHLPFYTFKPWKSSNKWNKVLRLEYKIRRMCTSQTLRCYVSIKYSILIFEHGASTCFLIHFILYMHIYLFGLVIWKYIREYYKRIVHRFKARFTIKLLIFTFGKGNIFEKWNKYKIKYKISFETSILPSQWLLSASFPFYHW